MRLSDEFIAKVDAWVADQTDLPGRSEAIRRLVELELKMTGMIEWLAYLLLIRSRSLLFEGQMPARDRKCFNEDTGWSLLRRCGVHHRKLPGRIPKRNKFLDRKHRGCCISDSAYHDRIATTANCPAYATI